MSQNGGSLTCMLAERRVASPAVPSPRPTLLGGPTLLLLHIIAQAYCSIAAYTGSEWTGTMWNETPRLGEAKRPAPPNGGRVQFDDDEGSCWSEHELDLWDPDPANQQAADEMDYSEWMQEQCRASESLPSLSHEQAAQEHVPVAGPPPEQPQ